jgi:mannose-6-phosphate isomerase-like protein (cupin superfamily)
MNVTPNPVLAESPFPGLLHATLAGSAQGLKRLSIWEQVLKSGSSTPPHSHDCEEVVMCLGGRGDLLFGDGRRLRFGVNQTLTIPPNQVHRTRGAAPGRGVQPDAGAGEDTRGRRRRNPVDQLVKRVGKFGARRPTISP